MDIIFTQVTMVKIAIIVLPVSMFGAVKSVSSDIMVTGRILMKFVVTGLCKKGCHVYISGYVWWEVSNMVGYIASELV
jgi:hypothetical protein